MPSAPRPTRPASKSATSSSVPPGRACTTDPSAVTTSRPATWADREAQRPPVPWVPVAIAPATVCRSMSPMLCSARPRPCRRSLSTCNGVPASTVTVIASRSTVRMPTSRSGRSSRPSATAMPVKEWPEPTILTVRPWVRAATTASTTSAGLVRRQHLRRLRRLEARPALPALHGVKSTRAQWQRDAHRARRGRRVTSGAPWETGSSPGSPARRVPGAANACTARGAAVVPEDAAIRRVHGDASMFVGGIRALLLQSLHPLAMAGVMDHSGFEGDPWGRLQRTSYFLAVTTFGAADDAERMVAAVRSVHETSGRHRPGRPALRGLGPAPAALGPRGRDRQLPRRPPEVRRAAARRIRDGTRTSRTRPGSRRRSGSPTRRAARPSSAPSSRPTAPSCGGRRPPGRPPGSCCCTRRWGWPPGCPTPALAAAAVGLMPVWARRQLRLPYLPVTERTVVRATGTRAHSDDPLGDGAALNRPVANASAAPSRPATAVTP